MRGPQGTRQKSSRKLAIRLASTTLDVSEAVKELIEKEEKEQLRQKVLAEKLFHGLPTFDRSI